MQTFFSIIYSFGKGRLRTKNEKNAMMANGKQNTDCQRGKWLTSGKPAKPRAKEHERMKAMQKKESKREDISVFIILTT